MSTKSNSINVPESKAAMEKFKQQAANEYGVPTTYYRKSSPKAVM